MSAMTETSSLQSQAYNIIKEKILSKSMDSDALYSETRLARELGISRTPLREALQCLSQDGYITIIPSRGFKIRCLKLQLRLHQPNSRPHDFPGKGGI